MALIVLACVVREAACALVSFALGRLRGDHVEELVQAGAGIACAACVHGRLDLLHLVGEARPGTDAGGGDPSRSSWSAAPRTLTVNCFVDELPAWSVASQVTVVVPIGKMPPEAWVQETAGGRVEVVGGPGLRS